jgi:hypothetical protein
MIADNQVPLVLTDFAIQHLAQDPIERKPPGHHPDSRYTMAK